ncbi:MAG: TIGR01777 family oxidoreductase [Pseudomonadota bacterium]
MGRFETGSMDILITGASGFIGSALLPYLSAKGHRIFKLERGKKPESGLYWDIENNIIELPDKISFNAVIHLAGENVGDSRWTAKKKERILSSRIEGTHLISKTIASLDPKPQVMLSSSGIGIYGDQGKQIVTEATSPGKGFLADVCKKWEAETQLAEDAGIRVAHLRIAPVLSLKGGIIKRLLPFFKLGLGASMGPGTQYLSWIVMSDLMDAMDFILHNNSIKGAVNLCTPNPVTNYQFAKILGKVINRPAVLNLPGPVLKILFGQMAEEELLFSNQAIPERLINTDLKFAYPDLEKALRYVIDSNV